jgi:hypothetical protein
MTESMPPTQVQMQAMQRALAEAVLDRACEDPQWKQQLIEDPQLAMRQANFPEAQEIQQVGQQQSEVQGQWWPGGGGWGGGGWGGGGWGGGGWGGGWWPWWWW